MRMLGYCRVSTDEQAKQGCSLAAQQERIQAYCKLHEHKLAGVISDEGLSAGTLERKGLQSALRTLEAGHADGLIVTKLDRLTRRTRDLLELVEGLFSARALISIGEHFDTSTANGRLMLTVLGAMAEWERGVIRERTREALAHLKEQGVPLGRPPYGTVYKDVDGLGRRTRVHAESRDIIIGRIRELRGGGESLGAIARYLNNDKVPTQRGGRWHAKTVGAILRREEK